MPSHACLLEGLPATHGPVGSSDSGMELHASVFRVLWHTPAISNQAITSAHVGQVISGTQAGSSPPADSSASPSELARQRAGAQWWIRLNLTIICRAAALTAEHLADALVAKEADRWQWRLPAKRSRLTGGAGSCQSAGTRGKGRCARRQGLKSVPQFVSTHTT